jgi:hypothetical protein
MRIINEYRYSPISSYVYGRKLNMQKAPNSRPRGLFERLEGILVLGRWCGLPSEDAVGTMGCEESYKGFKSSLQDARD